MHHLRAGRGGWLSGSQVRLLRSGQWAEYILVTAHTWIGGGPVWHDLHTGRPAMPSVWSCRRNTAVMATSNGGVCTQGYDRY